jgi:HSP20 family protein
MNQEQMTTTKDETRREKNDLVFQPDVDIYEKDGEIKLLADLPGVSEESLDISVEDDTLTLSAEQNRPTDLSDYTTRAEYRYGRFERSFTMSNEIDRNNITANLNNGVLTLTLPKKAEAKPKQIKVTAEG